MTMLMTLILANIGLIPFSSPVCKFSLIEIFPMNCSPLEYNFDI